MRKDDDNDEDETIDSLAKSVMDFILLQEDDDTERDIRDNVPAIKKRRQRKNREQYGSTMMELFVVSHHGRRFGTPFSFLNHTWRI